VVVAVGLAPVEPPADVDVNVPGVMAMLVAPAVAQLRVLLPPELMVAGSAVKEVMTGTEVFPDEPDDVTAPQPARATHAHRRSNDGQRSRIEALRVRLLRLSRRREFVESMGDSKANSVYC
jgi:hypothetical protein